MHLVCIYIYICLCKYIIFVYLSMSLFFSAHSLTYAFLNTFTHVSENWTHHVFKTEIWLISKEPYSIVVNNVVVITEGEWEVGRIERVAVKHIHYHMWNYMASGNLLKTQEAQMECSEIFSNRTSVVALLAPDLREPFSPWVTSARCLYLFRGTFHNSASYYK